MSPEGHLLGTGGLTPDTVAQPRQCVEAAEEVRIGDPQGVLRVREK